ncbi:MAG: hypothetical protein AAF560_12145, partial [Acidobacteriota bacterium]
MRITWPSTQKVTALGGVALALAVALWLARDLPRRSVERFLEAQLGARVEIGELVLRDLSRDDVKADLRAVRITRIRDTPIVEELRIAEIALESSWRGLFRSHLRSLTLRGLEAKLAPAPEVEREERPLPIIDRLVVEPASLRIAAAPGRPTSEPTSEPATELQASLRVEGFGQSPRGSLTVRSSRLPSAPLMALTDDSATPPLLARLDDAHLEVSFDATSATVNASANRVQLIRRAPLTEQQTTEQQVLELASPRLELDSQTERIDFELSADQLELTALDGAQFAEPRLVGSMTQGSGERLRFQLTPRLEGIDRAQLSGEWDREQARLVTVAGKLEALDLARWMPAAAVTGTADAQLTHRGDVVGVTVTLRPQELHSGSERILTLAEGATVELSTELPFAP